MSKLLHYFILILIGIMLICVGQALHLQTGIFLRDTIKTEVQSEMKKIHESLDKGFNRLRPFKGKAGEFDNDSNVDNAENNKTGDK